MRRERFENGRRPVLYVEDHSINALLMAAFFEHRPAFELVVAPTCRDALALAADLHPALLLLDLNLPDGDGFGLLRQLRRLPGCEHPPAVLVTADVLAEIDGRRFCERWTKPLDMHAVLDAVDRLAGGGFVPASSRRERVPAQPPAWR